MNLINKIGQSLGFIPVPTVKKRGFENLPQELLKKALTFLNPDIEQANLVNPKWKKAAEEAIPVQTRDSLRKNIALIQGFLNFLCENLQEHEIQRNKLLPLLEKSIPSNLPLEDYKSSFRTLRDQVIDVLKTLKDADLEKLNKLLHGDAKLKSFEKFMELALAAKQWDATKDFFAYCSINKSLIGLEGTDEVLQRLEERGNWYDDEILFCRLSISLANGGKIRAAYKVAMKINTSAYQRHNALLHILKVLVISGNLFQANELVDSVRCQDCYHTARLNKRFHGDKGQVKKEVHDFDKRDREKALMAIAKALFGIGQIEEALKYGGIEKQSRRVLLISALEESLEAHNLARAEKIYSKIGDKAIKKEAFQTIFKMLVAIGEIDKALEFAGKTKAFSIEPSFLLFCKQLKELYAYRKLAKAQALVTKVTDIDSALYVLSRLYLSINEIEGVVQIAKNISESMKFKNLIVESQNLFIRNKHLISIVKALAKNKKFKEAAGLHQLLVNRYIDSDATLHELCELYGHRFYKLLT